MRSFLQFISAHGLREEHGIALCQIQARLNLEEDEFFANESPCFSKPLLLL